MKWRVFSDIAGYNYTCSESISHRRTSHWPCAQQTDKRLTSCKTEEAQTVILKKGRKIGLSCITNVRIYRGQCTLCCYYYAMHIPLIYWANTKAHLDSWGFIMPATICPVGNKVNIFIVQESAKKTFLSFLLCQVTFLLCKHNIFFLLR